MITPKQWLEENRPKGFVGGKIETRRRSDFTDAQFEQLDDYTAILVIGNTAYNPQPTTLEAPTRGFTLHAPDLSTM